MTTTQRHPCLECDGTGLVDCECGGRDDDCPSCYGGDALCDHCDGLGYEPPDPPMPDPPWLATFRRVAAWQPPAGITLAVTLTPADGRVTAVLIHEGGGVASEAFDGGEGFGDGYGRLDALAGRLAGVAGVLAMVEMCEGVCT